MHLEGARDDLLGSGVEAGWVPEEQQLLVQAAIVGVPNAGKSTLTNALVGQKVGRWPQPIHIHFFFVYHC